MIKLDDGLVHATQRHESRDRYGETKCNVVYTSDPVHIGVIRRDEVATETKIARLVKPPLTCLMCIARSTA